MFFPWMDVFWCVVLAVTVKIVIFVVERWQQQQRFQKRGIPGPKPSFLAGNLFELFNGKDLPHEVMGKWLKEYGNVFGYYLGGNGYLVIKDLNLLRAVLIEKSSNFRNRPDPDIDVNPIKYSVIFQKDENWKRSRRTVQPVFGAHKVNSETISHIIKEAANRFVESLRIKASLSSSDDKFFEVGIYPRIQATSLDVIARTALNLNSINVLDDKDTLINAVREFFTSAHIGIVGKLAILFPFLKYLMIFINDHMTAGAMTDLTVKHIKKQILEAAKDRGQGGSTFLGGLLNNMDKGRLSPDEVVANGHIVLLAGYETTATSVTFLFYLLAAHPEIQEKLREFFREEKLQERDYFEMVWSEALRMYPPVALFVTRNTSEDIDLGSVYIEAGTNVQAPIWQIHHDPSIYPDPDTFNPERFSPEAKASLDSVSFLSFGCGPRICLGAHFSTQEARIITRKVLSKYKIMTTEQNKNGIRITGDTAFVHPADDVVLRFQCLD